MQSYVRQPKIKLRAAPLFSIVGIATFKYLLIYPDPTTTEEERNNRSIDCNRYIDKHCKRKKDWRNRALHTGEISRDTLSDGVQLLESLRRQVLDHITQLASLLVHLSW